VKKELTQYGLKENKKFKALLKKTNSTVVKFFEKDCNVDLQVEIPVKNYAAFVTGLSLIKNISISK